MGCGRYVFRASGSALFNRHLHRTEIGVRRLESWLMMIESSW